MCLFDIFRKDGHVNPVVGGYLHRRFRGQNDGFDKIFFALSAMNTMPDIRI